jgi:phage gp29-like protein
MLIGDYMASLMDRIRDLIGTVLTPSGERATKLVEEYNSYPQDPDNPKGSSRKSLTPEIGDPGTELWSEIYASVPGNPDNIPLKTYEAMLYGNGTAQAMFRVLQLPIMSTEYSIIPGSGDANGEVAKFCQNALENMEIPMRQVLFEVTGAFWAGFKMMEIVWHEKDGKIVPRKIAPRSQHTTKPVIDKHGNMVGVYQESFFMANNTRVFIPIEKVFWYTHRQKDMNWYGESDLKSAYPHYENLRKLYIIDNKAHEINAIPIRVAKPNVAFVNEDVKRDVFAKIRKIGLDTAVLIPKEIDLTFEGGNNQSTRRESIDHHTSQMAMSILAHFLQLGTNGQGTYNLSQDQSDMFLMLEKAEMSNIATAFMRQILWPMVKMNFGDDVTKFPKFEFSDMTDHVRKTVESIFLAIAQQGTRLSDDFIESLSQRVVEELGLDLNINNRLGSDVPKATVDQATLDKQAMMKFEAQAKASGAAKAGPGRGNTTGGANQKVAEAKKQVKPDNKGTSKANMSAEELIEFAESSVNARDFFGKVKVCLSNAAGIPAPSTPTEVQHFLDLADLHNSSDIVALAQIAVDMVNCAMEEVS